MKRLILSSIAIILFEVAFGQQVRVYEGEEIIPTYQLGANELSPIFYTGRDVQGAAGHYYPYPAQIKLGEKITNETYNMVYLENEYLKITIIPALGGRLFSAIDKTNGHELFHRNSVIKPDLIGTLGAWISGGIEWCFPHHHRPSTFLPADYFFEQHEDGSATVWIGETERGMRLRGIIGVTLHPGRSYIDVDYRLNNTSTTTKNFLFWANVAITSDDNFRTFWPPSQEIGVFHSQTSFTHWPISNEIYQGIDYTEGVDLTWWKNHPKPTSFFMWHPKEGFIGGYDYAKKAGTIHVGDVYNNPASKLWQFGPGLQGQNARRKLTDDGKAYVELMTGTFSNNQPDYSWFAPHSVKEAKNFWYPLRDIEIAKNATIDAAVTLQMRDTKTVFYGFNTTKKHENAKVLLRYDKKVVVSKSISIDPGNPFTATWERDKELDEYKISIELQNSDGNVLVSYTPYERKNPELPKVSENPKAPKEIESVEDLYLAGRFVEQFSKPFYTAEDYYLAALEKSPNDYRTNIALGIRKVNQWNFNEAEKYLIRAGEKLRIQYVHPKEGELFYYLAIAQQSLGKKEEAYRNFFNASWYYEWYAASYYQLAQMESVEGNYIKALEFIKNAYSTNNRDGRIAVLYTSLLRKLDKEKEALKIIEDVIKFDPLNFSAYYEKELLSNGFELSSLQKNMQDVDNNYLEIATGYLRSGMYAEGVKLLSSLKNAKSPLIYFYLAWFHSKSNQPENAKESLSKASALSLDYCFPYRIETEVVLKFAIEQNANSAVARYLLGNLLYDKRPEEGLALWNRAIEINDDLAMAWRNLAFGEFYHNRNALKAIELQEKAIAYDNKNSIWYAELVEQYDNSASDNVNLVSILEKNINVVKQDINAPKGLVKLYNLNGEYDKAIQLLNSHHFRTWEGSREIYWHYVDAHVLKAKHLMKGGDYKKALQELQTAMVYPENLEVGKPLDDERNAMVYFIMAQDYDKMGKKKDANRYYKLCINSKNSHAWPDLKYYQGMANKKLGNSEKANQLFDELIQAGQNIVDKNLDKPGVNKSLSKGYYYLALGKMGNGVEAKSILSKSLKAYKNNLWAKHFLLMD